MWAVGVVAFLSMALKPMCQVFCEGVEVRSCSLSWFEAPHLPVDLRTNKAFTPDRHTVFSYLSLNMLQELLRHHVTESFHLGSSCYWAKQQQGCVKMLTHPHTPTPSNCLTSIPAPLMSTDKQHTCICSTHVHSFPLLSLCAKSTCTCCLLSSYSSRVVSLWQNSCHFFFFVEKSLLNFYKEL